MTETMRAVVIDRFGGPEELNLREIPKPRPGEGEVLVRIRAAGLNPVDWKMRTGRIAERGIPHEFPVIIGWDMAGVVEECGFSARRFSPGDEVFAYCRRPVVGKGCYAEYISIPESYVTKKPKTVSFEVAASLPLVSLTAYQSVHDAGGVRDGETALILGATGGVGSCAVQLCRRAGARVIAVASGKNEQYIRERGASDFIDYTAEDFAQALKRILPEGADFVYDCQGGETLVKAYGCVKKGGRLVDIVQAPNQTALNDRNARAIYVFVEPNSRELDYIASLVESGELKTHVSKIFDLSQAQEAHRELERGHTTGKMVLRM